MAELEGRGFSPFVSLSLGLFFVVDTLWQPGGLMGFRGSVQLVTRSSNLLIPDGASGHHYSPYLDPTA